VSWLSKFILSQDKKLPVEDRIHLNKRTISAFEHSVIIRGILGQLDVLQETLVFLGCTKSASHLNGAILELENALAFTRRETNEFLKPDNERQDYANATQETNAESGNSDTQQQSRAAVLNFHEKRPS